MNLMSGAGLRLLHFFFLKRIIIRVVSLREQLFQTVRRLAGNILNGDALTDVGGVVRMALRGINLLVLFVLVHPGQNEDLGTNQFSCDGNHPFRRAKEKCACYPKTVQRGASSVYFPVVHSSLVIPPYTDKLNAKIEQSKAYDDCMTIISDKDPEEKIATITR